MNTTKQNIYFNYVNLNQLFFFLSKTYRWCNTSSIQTIL